MGLPGDPVPRGPGEERGVIGKARYVTVYSRLRADYWKAAVRESRRRRLPTAQLFRRALELLLDDEAELSRLQEEYREARIARFGSRTV